MEILQKLGSLPIFILMFVPFFEWVVHKTHCNRLTNFIKVIDNLLIHLVMNEIRFLLLLR